MPEGDTIYRTAATLRRWLGGRTITEARAVAIDAAGLVGRSIDSVDARGKHLLLRFSGGVVLHTHMRMTGSWHVYPAGERWRKSPASARVVLDAGGRVAVCFNAPVVELLDERGVRSHPALRKLGPDVLVPASLDLPTIRSRARQRLDAAPTVGELLLDQQVVAGIGNIYRCESLFLCGVAPRLATADVTGAELERLVTTASRLMATNAGVGSVPGAGPHGPSAIGRRFDGPAERTWVYGRAGRPCRRCATTVRSEALGRQPRTVYWCPACQRLPGG